MQNSGILGNQRKEKPQTILSKLLGQELSYLAFSSVKRPSLKNIQIIFLGTELALQQNQKVFNRTSLRKSPLKPQVNTHV